MLRVGGTGQWRLLRHGPAPAAWNMAVDEAILASCARGESPPTLRFYAWAPAAVSIGYAQPLADVDGAACRAAGVDVVRRITGGRAVLHEDEVTYSVVAPEDLLPGGVLGAYRLLAAALATGLRLLGAEVQIQGPAARPAGPGRPGAAGARGAAAVPCFAAASRYEIVAGGRKVAGSAQARRRGALLQHGSIPLALDPRRFAALLGWRDGEGGGTADAAGLLEARATGLAAVLGRRPDPDGVVDALAEGFRRQLGIDLVPGRLTAREEETAKLLAERKYGRAEWNGRR